jgi:flagellin
VSAQANPLTASALNGITVADGGGSVTINDITAGASSTSISSSAATVVQNIRGVAAVASSAARTQGSVSLISSSIDGLNIGGKAPENAGLTAGVTLATEVSRITGINSLNVLNAVSARNAISSIDSALDMANTARAALGAYQNRFISAVTNLQISVENLSISRSRIQDTDFASETSALTRSQILQQAGMAMLAQANSIPNRVLALLK